MMTVTTTGTGMEIRTVAVNPGLTGSMPWLADVANRFEKYKFRKLVFHYLPASAAVAGQLAMAFDFDPNDDPPATINDAMTFHDHAGGPVWTGYSMSVDLANGDRLPQKDTRPGLPGADLDLNVYDVGQFHVMTEGAAAAIVGFVEVEYIVDLFVHQIQNTVGGRANATTGLDATHLVGSDYAADANAFLPVAKTSTSVMTFTGPFEGIVAIGIGGTVLSANYAPVISSSGSANVIWQIVNAAGTGVIAYMRVRAIAGTTLTPTITATTVTSIEYMWGRGAYTSYA
jgi:hypothetical protein